MSRQSEPARGGGMSLPADQVERRPSERCPRATWQASTGPAAMHQASGQSFEDPAARQAINQER